MITIITGPINSGKTSLILRLYNEHGGDGFASVKKIEKNFFIGYDLKRLSTGASSPIARIKSYEEALFNKWFDFGNFYFSREAFSRASEVYSELISSAVEPIFIDEIGPIELDGNGFHDIFIKVLDSRMDVYAVVRESLLSSVLSKYNIESPTIIYITDGGTR